MKCKRENNVPFIAVSELIALREKAALEDEAAMKQDCQVTTKAEVYP